MAQKIVPHLWYDKEAREAAEFYVSVFPDSKLDGVSKIRDTPSGDCEIPSFTLWGEKFMAISAGPYFRFSPAISFLVNFDPGFFGGDADEARRRLDAAWARLSAGGSTLMPLDEYPWSKRYGWTADRYGLSWQLILTDPGGEPRPPIVPSLLFTGENFGKAEAAREFYLSSFRNSRPGALLHHGPGGAPNQEGAVLFSDFQIENHWFAAMDGPGEHGFRFTEAVSFLVLCEDQAEIDFYWDRLSAVPEAEQCGWLKDRFGVSWQVTPKAMGEMLGRGTEEQKARVVQAFLPMKKFDLAALRRAFEGR